MANLCDNQVSITAPLPDLVILYTRLMDQATTSFAYNEQSEMELSASPPGENCYLGDGECYVVLEDNARMGCLYSFYCSDWQPDLEDTAEIKILLEDIQDKRRPNEPYCYEILHGYCEAGLQVVGAKQWGSWLEEPNDFWLNTSSVEYEGEEEMLEYYLDLYKKETEGELPELARQHLHSIRTMPEGCSAWCPELTHDEPTYLMKAIPCTIACRNSKGEFHHINY